MENQEHTPTPWRISKSGYRYVHGVGEVESIYAPDGTGILAFVFRKENTECNARRIVAAVNACEGIETEMLELAGNGIWQQSESRFDAMIAELDGLRQQNAELLEALKGIIEIGKRDMSNPKYDGYFNAARAAIAEAENK